MLELGKRALRLDVAVANYRKKCVKFPWSVHSLGCDFSVLDVHRGSLHCLQAIRGHAIEGTRDEALGTRGKVDVSGAGPLAGLAHRGKSAHLELRFLFDDLPPRHPARVAEVIGQPDRCTLLLRLGNERTDLFPGFRSLLIKFLVEKTHVTADAVFGVFFQCLVVELVLQQTVRIRRVGEFLGKRLRGSHRGFLPCGPRGFRWRRPVGRTRTAAGCNQGKQDKVEQSVTTRVEG